MNIMEYLSKLVNLFHTSKPSLRSMAKRVSVAVNLDKFLNTGATKLCNRHVRTVREYEIIEFLYSERNETFPNSGIFHLVNQTS